MVFSVCLYLKGNIKIYRDNEFGIPNIMSKSLEGTIFGLG